MLKEGYTPFPVKTKLDKATHIISCCVHPHRNLSWFQNHATLGDLYIGLRKPTFQRPSGPVGYLNRFQGLLLLYANAGTFHENIEVSCPGSDIPVQSTVFRCVHCTHGGHCSSKGVETDGHAQG